MVKHLAPRLAQAYGAANIRIYAPVFTRDEVRDFHGMQVTGGVSWDYGENLLAAQYRDHRATMLLMGGDWFPLRVVPQLAAEDPTFLWVQSAPLDWAVVPQEVMDLLRYALKVVPWCTDAQARFREYGLANVTDPIPLGYDPAIWCPRDPATLPDLMHDLGFAPESFNVLCVSANQDRKMLKEQLLGLAEFHRRHPEADTRLYLHSWVEGDRNLEDDLRDVGLWGRHTLPDPLGLTMGGVPETTMAAAYNCASVVMDCCCEGFGLSMLQAQAVGRPVVYLNEGPGPEIVRYGAAVPVNHVQYLQRYAKAFPSPSSIANALEAIYQRGLHRRRSEGAIAHVQARYSWDVVAAQWVALIDEVHALRERYSLYIPEPSRRLRRMARRSVQVAA